MLITGANHTVFLSHTHTCTDQKNTGHRLLTTHIRTLKLCADKYTHKCCCVAMGWVL